MSEWISVKDRFPELTEVDFVGGPELRVYFCVQGRVMRGRASTSVGEKLVFWPDDGNGYFPEEISHWMPDPLPAPPEGKRLSSDREQAEGKL